MIETLLATGLGVIATTLGFRGSRVQPATQEHLDIVGAVKRLMRIVGPMAVLVGILSAVQAAGARMHRPDPMIVRHTVAIPEFGVQVTLPSTWNVGPSQPGTDFVASDSETGAILTGVVRITNANRPLSADIDEIVEDHRARFGNEARGSRGVMALGLLHAQWAELAYPGQDTATSIRTIALRRGNRVLALTCNGDDRAQAACGAAIKPEH